MCGRDRHAASFTDHKTIILQPDVLQNLHLTQPRAGTRSKAWGAVRHLPLCMGMGMADANKGHRTGIRHAYIGQLGLYHDPDFAHLSQHTTSLCASAISVSHS